MSERDLQEKIFKQFISMGYEGIQISNEKDLQNNLYTKIKRLNEKELKYKSFTEEDFRIFLNTELLNRNVVESAKKLEDVIYFVNQKGKPLKLILFDKNDFSNNKLEIAKEVNNKNNRYDLVVFLNGLPVVLLELKDGDYLPAFDQVKDKYADNMRKTIFSYIRIFVIGNKMQTRYFSNTDQKLSKKNLFSWSDENNNKYSKLEDFVKFFLEPQNLFDVITEYMVINDERKGLIVMRPHQIHAVKALFSQAMQGKNGHVHHATGSGKTLTSFKLGQRLKRKGQVFLLIDRKDLDFQTYQEFEHFEPEAVDNTDSVQDLKVKIKQTSGFLITTIQKMSELTKEEAADLQQKKQVFFIIDECHRSQKGTMHSQIKEIFPDARFFGFTGTPLKEENTQKGLTTKAIFGECCHSYTMKTAFSDGMIVKWDFKHYKATKNKEKKITRFLDNYTHQSHQGTFNALFATDGIPELMEYYRLMKKIIKKDYSNDFKIAAIFHPQSENTDKRQDLQKDFHELIQDYNNTFKTQIDPTSTKNYIENVSQRMKQTKKPCIDILLVVDMFLTGFDAPCLNTLCIDKELKYHQLIQAFSRVNRTAIDKDYGYVMSFKISQKTVDQAIQLFEGANHNMLAPDYQEKKTAYKEC
ncbi:type I restriction endonuclease subunit R, partial [Candidatus Phytoplasma meliae]